MPLSVQCPRCNQAATIADDSAGQRVKCPHCHQTFLAPGLASSTGDDDDWLQLDQKEDPHPLDDFIATTEPPPTPKSDLVRNRPGKPQAAPVEYATEYRVKCNICGSVIFVKASQAGKTIKCSDCYSPITIPSPPKVPQKQKMDIDSAATFKLEQPTSVRRKETDPNRKSAAQLLEEAAREESQAPKNRDTDTPDIREWLAGVFGIFRDMAVLTHWVGLSIVAALAAVLVIAIDKPLFYLMTLPAGLFFGALVVSCGFAILQSVANGEKQVSEWPILDPPSWLGELVVAIAAAAVVAAPVAAVSQLLNLGMLGIAVTMFAIYGFFPFVLLSMMDMNSPLKPFSAEVARSVNKCEEAWGGFYFSSGLLFAALFLLIVGSRAFGLGVIGVVISIFAAVGTAFIYFAMIGRLAYAIGQAVNAPPTRKEEPAAKQPGDSR